MIACMNEYMCILVKLVDTLITPAFYRFSVNKSVSKIAVWFYYLQAALRCL